jgi:hypothetical protein
LKDLTSKCLALLTKIWSIRKAGNIRAEKEEKSNSIGGRKNSNAGIYQLISGPLVRVNNAARRGLLGIRRHIMQSIKKVK